MYEKYIVESRNDKGELTFNNWENEKKLPDGYITGLTLNQLFNWFFKQKDSREFENKTGTEGLRAYLKTLGLTMRQKTW